MKSRTPGRPHGAEFKLASERAVHGLARDLEARLRDHDHIDGQEVLELARAIDHLRPGIEGAQSEPLALALGALQEVLAIKTSELVEAGADAETIGRFSRATGLIGRALQAAAS